MKKIVLKLLFAALVIVDSVLSIVDEYGEMVDKGITSRPMGHIAGYALGEMFTEIGFLAFAVVLLFQVGTQFKQLKRA